MAETTLSTPDPDEPEFTAEQFQAHLDKVLPGAVLVAPNYKGRPSGQIDVTACLRSNNYWNGRLDGDSWGYNVNVTKSVPPKPPGYDSWREQVKRSVRKEKARVKGIPNRLKAIPGLARDYARYRIHDYFIGWVLDVNVDPWSWSDFRSAKERAEDDVFLHL